MENQGNVKATVEAVERLAEPEYLDEVEIATTGLAILPVGKQVVDLKQYQDKRRTKPERLTGCAKHTTLDSFVAHVNRFKDPKTAIFADDTPASPKLLAVYDYHLGPSDPRFGGHRALYDFPLSEQWRAWRELEARSWVSQAELAVFLEDHLADIFPPDSLLASTRARADLAGMKLGAPGSIAALAKNLSVNVSAEFSQATTLATGEGQLLFKESHTTSVPVPSGFALSIPVFRGGLAEDVMVRLRYRPAGGKVVFSVAMHDVDALFRRAFNDACARVEDATKLGDGPDAAKLSLFFGSPEVSNRSGNALRHLWPQMRRVMLAGNATPERILDVWARVHGYAPPRPRLSRRELADAIVDGGVPCAT